MASYLITGTNTGIGRTTAEALAARGARVILTARSREKALPVVNDLRARFPNAEIEFMTLDLADLQSVRAAASAVVASGRPLDVLINNAGVAGAEGTTKDGFEITFGTNHLGHFALTEMLLPVITARVVNVASEAHRNAKGIDFEALRRPGERQRAYAAYAVSKLANILHAKELAQRARVSTYALHPGVVATDIWRQLPKWVQGIMKLFMISSEKGAVTTVYCATAPEIATVSGRYFDKCREKAVAPLANNEALARDLYAWSDSAVTGVLGPGWRSPGLVSPSKPTPA
jgi:retinol dehydrogenase 12